MVSISDYNFRNMKKYIYILTTLIAFGCTDYLIEEPTALITNDLVIEAEEDYNSTVLGIYDGFQSTNSYGNLLISMPGVLSDEMIHTGSFPTVTQMDLNDVLTDNVTMRGTWDRAYNTIFRANFLIENIDVISLDAALKNQYLGEARFGRALALFDLVKFYGGVPLATSTDLAVLREIPRGSESDIYNFIKLELADAASLLQGLDLGPDRATEWAAKALLARVNLYTGDLATAGNLANDVISNGGFALEANYTDVFSGASNEVIFQVSFNPSDQSGLAFQHRTDGRLEYGASPQLVSAFEAGDARAVMVEDTGSGGIFMAAKYTDVSTGTDPTVILRLAEMYLIRAEANLGSTSADNDINALRTRAGIGTISGADLDDVLQERFVELCFEGHRWNDLIRTGRVDQVMSVVNPSTWVSTDALLPIPQRELNQNESLGQQNPGY